MSHPLDAKSLTTILDDLRLISDRWLAGIGMAVLVMCNAWFIRTDLESFATDWPLLRDRLILRSCLATVALVGLILLRVSRSRRAYSVTAAIIGWAAALLVLAVVIIRPAGSGLPWRLPAVFLTVSYFTLPNSRWRQIGPPMVASAGLVALRLTWLSEGGVVPGVDVAALAALNLIGIVTVVWRTRLETVMAEAIGRLHDISGTIKVCTTCRRVDGEVAGWQPLDDYVRARSLAQFTETSCPTCASGQSPRRG